MTGKRELYMDGKIVHTSKVARGNTKFEYSWSVGPHILKLIANGTPPSAGAGGERSSHHKKQRQFDLELDGMSYFDFKKIYELGGGSAANGSVKKRENVDTSDVGYRGLTYDDEREDEEEVEDVQQQPEVTAVDLLFDGPPSPTSVIPTLSTSTISSASIENMSSPYYYDEFAPVQKTYNSISNEILSAYGNNTPPAAAVDSSSCRALVLVEQPQALSAYQGTMQYY